MAFEMRDNPGTAFAFISDNAGKAIELIEHKTPRWPASHRSRVAGQAFQAGQRGPYL